MVMVASIVGQILLYLFLNPSNIVFGLYFHNPPLIAIFPEILAHRCPKNVEMLVCQILDKQSLT